LLEKLSKINGGKDFILVGYYLDNNTAQESLEQFTNAAEKFGITNYSAALFKMNNATTNSSQIDYWGNPIKN